MKVYLVWARASYCDYGVVNVLLSKEEAEVFIKKHYNEFVEHYRELDEDDFWIEEREIGVPIKLVY
jgi:hypothetical protein